MAVELKIPEIGESITQVVIGEWLKDEDDPVERDEDVVVIESDKATVEIPAPESGTLVKILKRSGETASVGEAIGVLEPKGSESPESTKAAPKKASSAQDTHKDKGEKTDFAESHTREKKEAVTQAVEEVEHRTAEKELQNKEAKPKIVEKGQRATAEEKGEREISALKDFGPKKTKSMDRELAEEGEVARAKHDGEASHVQSGGEREIRRPDSEMPASVATDRKGREEKVIPMTPIRRRIAERLVQAQQRTAFLTTFNEIDMSAVNAIRQRYQEEFQKSHDVKLGLMSFFVKASIEALKFIPEVNAEIRDADIVYRNYYDIGVAVGSGKGLVVPVLRNAEEMSFAAVEQAIEEFARKAAQNQLKPDDLVGGTFTISNGGIYGSLLSTPIINAPQSGILGMHAIQDRPVARDGQIVIRPMMYVALTYDHRIVDGREAVAFLKRIKQCVEAPSRILLEV
jgi:2-oxoglutarate dehydrogenase E2 component (dihydrolipoamide succinyltransferase)